MRWGAEAGLAKLLFFVLLLGIVPVRAQQPGPVINPRIPPPPPPEQPAPPPAIGPSEQPSPSRTQPAEPRPALPRVVPATVVLPAGTRIPVVLDTPLSTRISKKGQIVTFRTEEALPLQDALKLAPGTAFIGSVIKVRRPGPFGKSGEIRVKVERMSLASGAGANVVARLDSADMNGQGRTSYDNNRAANIISLATWTVEGTLVGAQIHGGKGAAIGAGAGAAIAMIILMSRRGSDVYLEPGMPFQIILDQPVSLPGGEIAAAQQSDSRANSDNSPEAGTASTAGSADPNNPATDADRPKLKRRPKNPQP